MKSSKTVRQAIRQVESSLTWQVVTIRHDQALDIISDPTNQVHTIRLDREDGPAGPIRQIEYLHELAHAWLAEREPVFCVHHFIAPGCDMSVVLQTLSDPVRMTADWFVDDLLMKWAPAAETAEIEEHVHLVRRTLCGDPTLAPSDMSLVLAQGVYYNIASLPSSLHNLQELILPFLSVPPRKPSRDNFSRLFNSLLSPHGLTAKWSDPASAWLVSNL